MLELRFDGATRRLPIMSTFSNGLRRLRCHSQIVKTQWTQPTLQRPTFQLAIRTLNTESTSIEASGQATLLEPGTISEQAAQLEAVKIPFRDVAHARAVPAIASYFSRTPELNELYIRISQLLSQYHHLPTITQAEAPTTSWMRLKDMRAKLGEPIKASHYAKVIRVAKRLNLIEPTLLPEQVRMAVEKFKRDINPFSNVAKPGVLDAAGRAVGVGKRKESTARAFVVEGNGEVLVNGKSLSQAFGRVHDRESAIWALQATERLDKYNVWALVEGGGTTGQAEALTLAVAKALIVHEPALKTALKKGAHSPIFSSSPGSILTSCPQLDVSHETQEQSRGRSMATSRPERCLLGSSDKRNRLRGHPPVLDNESISVWGLVRWMVNGLGNSVFTYMYNQFNCSIRIPKLSSRADVGIQSIVPYPTDPITTCVCRV